MSFARRVRKRCFWSSSPQRSSWFTTRVFCTSTGIASAGSTREISSMASTDMKKLAPAPPYSSGISMPIRPSSNSSRSRSSGWLRACSISATRGRILSSANSRTVSRKIRSSSASSVIGAVMVSPSASWWLWLALY